MRESSQILANQNQMERSLVDRLERLEYGLRILAIPEDEPQFGRLARFGMFRPGGQFDGVARRLTHTCRIFVSHRKREVSRKRDTLRRRDLEAHSIHTAMRERR